MGKQNPAVDNQHGLFLQFFCHELQRMVAMDKFSSSVGTHLMIVVNILATRGGGGQW
jgi:hypothetical protein